MEFILLLNAKKKKNPLLIELFFDSFALVSVRGQKQHPSLRAMVGTGIGIERKHPHDTRAQF